jgi:hypothetical protein
MQEISSSNLGKNYVHLRTFLNGIKSELATIRAFKRDGFDYKVYLPDYTQNRKTVKPHQNEVLQWDVNSGVDLVAISKIFNEVLLVDITGSKDLSAPKKPEMSAPFKKTDIDNLTPTLRQLVRQHEGKVIVKTKFHIPTAPHLLAGLDTTLPPREALQQFGSLSNDHELAIINGTAR